MGLFGGGILYFIFCIIVGCAASNRGRSGIGYFFLSLILSPLIAFIIILVLGENKNIRMERMYEEAEIKESVSLRYKDEDHNASVFRNASNNLIPYNDTKKCPFCAELIKREAIICRFCGRDIKDYENEKELINNENRIKHEQELDETLDRFLKWAEKSGWKILLGNNSTTKLPTDLIIRYNIPYEYKIFLEKVKQCITSDDHICFLCIDDYLDNTEDACEWNWFETTYLDKAKDNYELMDEIKIFWDNHLPIIFNIENTDDYKFYAININNKNIVFGCETIIGKSKIIASNFNEFLEKIINEEIIL